MIYYETELGKLYQGDCLEVMKQLPDNSVDLVLTDPPYGVGLNYGETYEDTQENLKKLIDSIMPELFRVSKRIVLTCGHTNIWKYPEAKWIMAWINQAGANRNSWGFTCWQPILCYGKDPYLENRMGARHDIIIHNERSEKLGHCCPKPIRFWEKLLLRSSVKETDIILDPFLGSGTTAIACEKLNRRWIGIEINKEYCEIAKARIEAEARQGKLL